jgi:AraC family transcriptional regulator
MELQTTTFGPAKLFGFRHQGPYHLIGEAFGKLGPFLQQSGIPMELMLGVYYDDPTETPAEELRSIAAAVIPTSFELPGGTEATTFELPEQKYAVYTHMGSYTGLGGAWMAFGQAFGSSGLNGAPGPALEIYRNDCSKVPEAEVRTDLMMAIQ